MRIGDLCKQDVITVRRHDELVMAARSMRDQHIGFLVVVEPIPRHPGLTPIGVLTDRDILVSVFAGEIDPQSLIVDDVMTPEPTTANANDSLQQALQQMSAVGVRRAPVVNDIGELVGVLALDDIARHFAELMGLFSAAITQGLSMERALRPARERKRTA
jgi:CBS domain-containing protein